MAKRICPRCGSKNTAKILWGMPAYDEELQKKLDNKEIVLGGCCITGCDPSYHCNACKKDFGAPTKNLEADVIKVMISIGGFFQGHKKIEVSKTDNGATIKTSGPIPNYNDNYEGGKDITALQWKKFVNALFRCNVADWKKKYYSQILDGEQWELEIYYTGRKPLKIWGSNNYPPHFSKLRKLLDNPPWAGDKEKRALI